MYDSIPSLMWVQSLTVPQEYLNNVTVQKAIGARVNFTQHSNAVFRNFGHSQPLIALFR